MRQAGTAALSEVRSLRHEGPASESVLGGILAVFDCLPVGAILVDACGRVLVRNRLAIGSLRLGAGVHETEDGRLRCDFAADSAALTRTLARLASEVRPRPVVLTPHRMDGKRALELMLRASPGGHSVTVFIADPETPATFNALLAQQLYGLSDREVDVARALVRGCTLAETAACLRVERETVRSHLKQLFSKTQTTRQADVVRLFSSGLFGMGAEP